MHRHHTPHWNILAVALLTLVVTACAATPPSVVGPIPEPPEIDVPEEPGTLTVLPDCNRPGTYC